MTDKFRDRRDPRGYSTEYYEIINEIENGIKQKYPNTFESISPIIQKYVQNTTGGLDLLHGLVQSGKSPAIIIIMWLLNIKYDIHTLFLTKKLGSIREDFVDKLKNGFLNTIIDTVCIARKLTSIQTNYFKLTPKILSDRDKTCERGYIPILLMEPHNYKELVGYYFRTFKDTRSAPCVALIDEVHELYTDLEEFVVNKGLIRGKKSNRHILHWLINKAQAFKCQVLGITATPYRAMSSDPICCPREIYNLNTDQPFPGAKYYGYNIKQEKIQNITIHQYSGDEMSDYLDLIETILLQERRRVCEKKEILVICVMIEAENGPQEQLYHAINEKFDDLVYCKTFHQGKSSEINCELLDSFFNSNNLTAKICESGALILIGKNRMSAGITVKPSLKSSCTATFDNIEYSVYGITDQIMDGPSHAQASMQLMRIFGWYPENHASRLWVPEGHECIYDTELIRIDNQFRDNFDPLIGYNSVAEIISSTPLLKRICGSGSEDPYIVANRYGFKHKLMNAKPADGIELKTKIIHAYQLKIDHPKWASVGKTTLSDFRESRKPTRNKKEHMELHKEVVNSIPAGYSTEKLLIGCDKERIKQIYTAAVSPKEHGSGNNWQVNSILTGSKGHLTPLNELVLIVFEKNWEEREKMVDGQTFYFYTGFGYMVITQSKIFKHKYIEFFDKCVEEGMSEIHKLACGADIDKLFEDIVSGKVTIDNAWHIFVQVHKLMCGSGAGAICSGPYANLKKNSIKFVEFEAIVKSKELTRDDKIKKCCKFYNEFVKPPACAPTLKPLKIKKPTEIQQQQQQQQQQPKPQLKRIIITKPNPKPKILIKITKPG